MKKIILFIFVVLVGLLTNAAAQTISGIVTDKEDGSAIPGVNVLLKGTSQGVITDLNGKYSIDVTGENPILVFSYIGYEKQEIVVGKQTSINISLKVSATGLEEVVVVGYGVQKKSLVTGSISKINSDELQSTSSLRIDQAIQGKSAGVLVLPTSGSPGAGTKIRIRGTNSNGNSNPLYIVDGMKTGDINNIDPGDVESIEILKDAASSAIYGTEGGNGVILVTTKSGKAGKSTINYTFQYGIQSVRTKMRLMDANQYTQWMAEAGLIVQDRFNANTNWIDQTFQKAPMQKHHIGFSGGTAKTTYMISGSYLNQDGIVGGNKADYNRYTARVNLKSKVKKWLEVGTNMSFMHSRQKYVGEDDEYRGVVNNILLMDPLTPVTYDGTPSNVQNLLDQGYVILKNKSGNYYGLAENVTGETSNPLARIDTYHNSIVQDKILGSSYIKLMPFKGFAFTSRIGLDLAYQNQHFWTPKYYFSTESSNTVTTIDDQLHKWNTWLWENFATYTNTFGAHTITGLLGYSAQKYQGPAYTLHSGPMIAEGDNYAYHNYATSRDLDKVGGWYSENTMASIFARLSYNYKGKYLLEGSLRRDGSSVFPENDKYGIFPSVSAGWVVSNEDFFNVNFINNLKIRASWGSNGSKANLPGNEDKEFWTFGGIRYPDATDNFQSGARIDKLINTDLVWERTEETDIGLDFNFLDSKITFSADYYNKMTKNLIVVGTGPLSVGNNYPFVNGGDVSNKGFDFEISYRNMDNIFKYGVSFNLSTVKNNVTKLAVDAPVRGDNLRGYDLTWFEQGQPIWYFKGYKTSGINPTTGEVIIVDVNGDGQITPEDQTYIGNPHPDLLFGGNIDAQYKGFDINVFFQGSYGNDVFMGWYRTDRPFSNKPAYFFDNRWTASNTNASFPAANNTSDYIYRSDLMISDGSYLRFKQIQFGYTLPKNILIKVNIESLRLFVSLDDYFTITKYKGLDPEAGSSNDVRLGVDRGLYPAAGKILFGLSINF